MEKDVVVYFGMGFLPDHNAVACREQALGHIVKAAGYTPALIGVNTEVPFGEFVKDCCNESICYHIRYANTITEKLRDTFIVEKTLIRIIEDIGAHRIKCFIMQDYQLRPMKKMVQYCRANAIAFAADIMDWFVPSRDYSLVKNITKTIDTYFRMHWFYPYLNNKICITHKFKQFFENANVKNTLVLPCTCVDAELPMCKMADNRQNVTITFAGFLQRKCEKEKLDWLIQALYENHSSINLNIIGLTQQRFLSIVPTFSDKITDHVHFHGYLPRHACVDILEQSDFAIIVRKKSRLTEYGFSSKICEAFAHGIPVIATNNSDNAIYIRDGINGFLCEANYEAVKELLCKIELIDRNKIQDMQRQLHIHNPLSITHYIDSFSKFLDDLIICK